MTHLNVSRSLAKVSFGSGNGRKSKALVPTVGRAPTSSSHTASQIPHPVKIGGNGFSCYATAPRAVVSAELSIWILCG